MFTRTDRKVAIFSYCYLHFTYRSKTVKVKVKLRRCCELLLAVPLTYRAHRPQYATQIKNATFVCFSYDLTYSLTAKRDKLSTKTEFFEYNAPQSGYHP